MINVVRKILNKLLRGNDQRKTRLHDRHGNLVPIRRLFSSGVRALLSFLALKVFGVRPKSPWISYSALAVIAKNLEEQKGSVLEFGSGMSTLWFAEHATHVCSIEHDSEWYELVKNRLAESNHSAVVQSKLATTRTDYSSCKSNFNELFDIILVDGPWRAECLKHNMHLIDKGGIIYLDNSDAASSTGEEGEMDLAVKTLTGFAKEHGAFVERYTDFSPTSLFVSQGLLVQMPQE